MDTEIKKVIIDSLKENGATLIKIFGSYARGQQTDKSDIDIIVNFKESKSLLELIKIERELSEKIKIKVDLLTEKSISPLILEKIKNQEIVIYGN